MKIKIPALIIRYPFQFWTAFGLLVWVLFFDGSNLFGQFRLWRKQSSLEKEKVFYLQKIKDVKREHREVMGTAKSREKFAREKYLMRKKGETIFVIVGEDGKSIEDNQED